MTAAPAITSMTGFARAEGRHAAVSWVAEVKSVNGRGLDVRCRLPAGFEAVEPVARAEIGKRFKRGTISLTVTMARAGTVGQLRLNRDLLDQVIGLARELQQAETVEPLRLDSLLSVRGIIEPAEESEPDVREALEAMVTGTVVEAVGQLADARLAEGRRLADILATGLASIAQLTEDAANSAAAQPEAIRERLRAQVASFLDAVPPLPEERIVQEAALLATRSDVREELDRLKAHIQAAHALMAEGGAIGRRFDFLCQELNREANTLCSKSSDVALTRIGLALKAGIEQVREQVQNVE